MNNVKNAEVFSRLVDFCTGYGGSYNPGRTTLQIEALIAQKQKVNNTIANVIGVKSLYDNAVNQRKQAFDLLPKLVSSVLRTLEASEASSEKLNDARAFANKAIRPSSKDRPALPSAAAVGSAPGDPTAKRSRKLQLAYVSKIDGFAKLVDAVANEPLYQPNEPALGIARLTDVLSTLRTFNEQVSIARVAWSNARIDRNDTMYHQSQSMYNTGRAVKKYVRAIFGHDSEQFAQLKNLQFTKPTK